MNRIILLIFVCLVLGFCINSSYAFCSGCSCNIWGCNCDYRKICTCSRGRSLEKYGNETLPGEEEAQRFKSIDINNDKVINKNEAILYLTKINKGSDLNLVTKWFNQADINGDGLIQLNEFSSND